MVEYTDSTIGVDGQDRRHPDAGAILSAARWPEPPSRVAASLERPSRRNVIPSLHRGMSISTAPLPATPAGRPDAGERPAPWSTRPDGVLFVAALFVFAVTRLVGLDRFPIYFFSDEAIHANLAQHLLAHGGREPHGTLLPTFFRNDDRWNLALSVYLHVPTVALFGKSVVALRATSALITVLGAVFAALTMKQAFGGRAWWMAVVVMAALPTWFLHGRTGFEVAMMVSFYAGFVWAYVRYRLGSTRHLPLALVLGAATFYGYTNGQGVMLATGAIVLLTDLRHHLRQPRRVLAGAAMLAVLLAAPYLRFRIEQPNAIAYQLHVVSSYWVQDDPLPAKLATFARAYAGAFDPRYWFLPNDVDLARHRVKDVGHFPLFLFPFVVVGLAVCLARLRSPAHRVVVVALVAAPISAAIATVYVTRAMAMVVPVTLLACIGFDWLADRLEAWRVPRAPVTLASGAALAVWSLWLLGAALTSGPTWFTDYGLYGMQWGAAQVFDATQEVLEASPEAIVHVSPDWTNHANALAEFFLPPDLVRRVQFGNIAPLLREKVDIPDGKVFVLSPQEVEELAKSGKVEVASTERVIPYPDGRPGFHFVRLRYVPGVEAVFAREEIARRRPVEEVVDLVGQRVRVRHSRLDRGRIVDLFDGNPEHLIRGESANPLVLELLFQSPHEIAGIAAHTAQMDLELKIVVTPAAGGDARTYTTTYEGQADEPRVDFTLPDGPVTASALRLEFRDLRATGGDVHVHIRDLELR